MAFQPIDHAPGFSYSLARTQSEEKSNLTIEWHGRQVTVPCFSENSSDIHLHQLISEEAVATDRPIPIILRKNCVAYVNPLDATNELAQQIIGYIRLEQELEMWVNEKDLDWGEHFARPEAKELIHSCIEESSTKLNLLGLDLATLPKNIGQMKHLTELNLSDNQLTVLPESIGKLTNLTHLDLSHNELTNLPVTIENWQSLQVFSIANNPFRSLPNSIVLLPSALTIHIEGHNLSEETLNNLRVYLQARRSSGLPSPNFQFDMPSARNSTNAPSLETSLAVLANFVSPEHRIQFSLEPFKKEASHPARLWLHNLLQTSDFAHGSRMLVVKLAEVVLNAFKYVAEHEDFQEHFKLFLDTANVSCVDRTTLSLIELEILIELKKRSELQDHVDSQQLLKSIWTTHLLHEFADETIKKMPFVDVLDVHLAFLIHCKDKLKKAGIDLPFSSEKMQFFGITGISDSMLNQAAEEVLKQVHSKNAPRQFIEFLLLEHNVIAHFSLLLFEHLSKDKVQEIKAEKEQIMEMIEKIRIEKSNSTFDPKSLDHQKLPPKIRALLLKEELTDSEVRDLYKEVTDWQKEQYVRLAKTYFTSSQ